MYLVDYHMHSKYSFDGKCELRDMCEVAIKRGLSEIAITDHMDIFSNQPYTHILDCRALYAELYNVKEEYEGKLKIVIGVEYGQPQANPEQALLFMKEYPVDFTIGSIHNMVGDKDAYDYNYRETDYHDVFSMYMDWQQELAKNYDYDVLAHVTYPSRYVYAQTGVRVDFKEYWEQYITLFKTVIERGRGIELNLSGIARGYKETMPTMELLQLYRSLGGEIVTVGSDAHILDHIGTVTKEGYEMLRQAGFAYVTTFQKHQPRFVKI